MRRVDYSAATCADQRRVHAKPTALALAVQRHLVRNGNHWQYPNSHLIKPCLCGASLPEKAKRSMAGYIAAILVAAVEECCVCWLPSAILVVHHDRYAAVIV